MLFDHMHLSCTSRRYFDAPAHLAFIMEDSESAIVSFYVLSIISKDAAVARPSYIYRPSCMDPSEP
jgi:hypothetical protein